MPNVATIKEGLSKRASDTLEELEGYFKDEAETLEAIKEASDKLDDAIHEIADGRVSVYHSERYEWAANNHIAIANGEEEAISCGSKSVSDIIAWCWYESERDEIRDDIATIANVIPDEE